MKKGYIVDTETSRAVDGEVIELAYGSVEFELQRAPGDLFENSLVCSRFKPLRKISCGAMAVHHIIPSDLADCPPSAEAKLPDDCGYMIGHNVDFDWKVLGSPTGVKRICTLAFVRDLWPDVEGHSLGACIYRIMHFGEARDRLKTAHNAGTDVLLCADLLEYLLVEYFTVENLEELWLLSEEARMPKIWTFGKFKGKKIEATDRGYLHWCLKQPDMDEYVKKACEKALQA